MHLPENRARSSASAIQIRKKSLSSTAMLTPCLIGSEIMIEVSMSAQLRQFHKRSSDLLINIIAQDFEFLPSLIAHSPREHGHTEMRLPWSGTDPGTIPIQSFCVSGRGWLDQFQVPGPLPPGWRFVPEPFEGALPPTAPSKPTSQPAAMFRWH